MLPIRKYYNAYEERYKKVHEEGASVNWITKDALFIGGKISEAFIINYKGTGDNYNGT